MADAGYWHTEQMQRMAARGIPVLIPPDAHKRNGVRPGWTGGMYEFMRGVLNSEHGKDLYRRRQGLIEPAGPGRRAHRRPATTDPQAFARRPPPQAATPKRWLLPLDTSTHAADAETDRFHDHACTDVGSLASDRIRLLFGRLELVAGEVALKIGASYSTVAASACAARRRLSIIATTAAPW